MVQLCIAWASSSLLAMEDCQAEIRDGKEGVCEVERLNKKV
jgi:hypothetical protein